ncbi:MAG: response regulator [Ignavibacteriales bacterium]|nr:response regulator [Ignavibacteriales bacterium]
MFSVLIAEPQGEIQARLYSFFASRGHTVVATAKDGMEAYAKIQLRKPDLVLLSVNLTRMDNIALARWVKAWSPATRVVFVTPHEGETFRQFVVLLSIEGSICALTLEKDLSAILTKFTQETVPSDTKHSSYNYSWGETL